LNIEKRLLPGLMCIPAEDALERATSRVAAVFVVE
jgi:hypothetical protein